MANSSIVLSDLDFDTYKNNLKSWMKSQSTFKDLDFEGSNISVLIDLLAYNTYQNAFYLNMVASEMFLDSAQLESSVISHSKELNYLPKSFSSAIAELDIIITSSDPSKTNIVIPKGTSFSAKVDQGNYIFSTSENLSIQKSGGVFRAEDVKVSEGIYQKETYISSEPVVISNLLTMSHNLS